jgi:hypothetical protein
MKPYFYEGGDGINATFGFNSPIAGSIVPGAKVAFNQIITNDSKVGCENLIHLDVGTGDIRIKKSASYLIALTGSLLTAGAGEILSLVDGNGKQIPIQLDTLTAGTVTMFLKAGTILSVQNTGVPAIPYTVSTNTALPQVLIAIAELRR